MKWKAEGSLDGPVPMESELDLGFDGGHCTTLKNGASLEEIEVFLEELRVTKAL